jgi:predicted alpha-1,6-mannanase (GH76 family)
MGACASTSAVLQLAVQSGTSSSGPFMAALLYRNQTPAAAINTLQSFYSEQSGMFGSYHADYWTSANGIEALVNYMNITGDRTFADDVSRTFNAVSGEYFNSGYFDDQLWYANAWLRQFELSGDGAYLAQANTIVAEMLEKHDAWTSTCGGGVNWGINHNYKNTITNVLFGLACSKLYAYGLPGADGKGYDAWAQVRLC